MSGVRQQMRSASDVINFTRALAAEMRTIGLCVVLSKARVGRCLLSGAAGDRNGSEDGERDAVDHWHECSHSCVRLVRQRCALGVWSE